ncbi:M50 family metallopeptidase [Lachnoclostridium sp. Marseille-P6806]|uniref:M50 family metallopeptidase n=1 Tax=Lachnoclostridium sp. Marseille-P6806 TaxID=2364793 RepID=UPI001F5FBE9E|nr:M50 family metallopeptidase [Lachnoclostridium sp. Marseille-P6806]
MSMLVSVLIFLLIFGVIVTAHELGHFAIARRNGIRVRAFDLGMGPTFLHRKFGETDFCLKAFPIGGACIFDGMPGEESASDAHSFAGASVWARIATVLAGPAANFLIGFVLAVIIAAFSGTDRPVVGSVMEGSAAEAAGIEAGDVITRINGRAIHLYREVRLESMMNYGETMDIRLLRDGEVLTVTLTPRYDETDGRYYIGIIGSGEYTECRGFDVFRCGYYECEYWFRATWQSIGLIFRGHFSSKDLSGPVGVVKAVDDTYQATRPYGIPTMILSFMNLTLLLTINLGIMNLLPIPALDGGRLLIYLVEAIRRKPLSAEKEGLVTMAGAIALAALMVFVLFQDITRFFE